MSLHVRSGKVGARQNRLTTPFVTASALTEDRSKSVYMFGFNLVCPVVFLCAGPLVVFFVFVVFRVWVGVSCFGEGLRS